MRLINYFLPLFQFSLTITSQKETEISCDMCLKQADDIIAGIKSNIVSAYSDDDFNSALFACVSWFDEQILLSDLSWRNQWQQNLLQSSYFKTSIGGVLFFDKLDDVNNNDLRQVYLFCLLMGFCGKYIKRDADELQNLISQCRDCLPVQWQVWPSDVQITPVQRVKKRKTGFALRFNTQDQLCWPVMAISSYLILLVTGFLLTL